jgi:hypothetical protein
MDGHCAQGWICEAHPMIAWPHEDCAGPGVQCSNAVLESRLCLVERSRSASARSGDEIIASTRRDRTNRQPQ